MGTHKNIGKAVKEKLASYTDAPDDLLWNSIEKSLDDKKKKRRIPIWWWLTGGIMIGVLSTLGYVNLRNQKHVDSILPLKEKVVNIENRVIDDSNNPPTYNVTIDTKVKNDDSESVHEQPVKTSISSINSSENAIQKNKESKLNLIPIPGVNNPSINKVVSTKNDTEPKLLARNEILIIQDKNKSQAPQELKEELKSNDSDSYKVNQSLKNKRDSIKALNEKNRQLRIEKRQMLADLNEKEPKDSTETDKLDFKPAESPWSVTAMGIVTHYQNLNNGNSLDKDYDDLLVEDRVSLNYGASLNFIANDYLQLRIGINHMRFNQTTRAVPADFNEITDLQYVSYEVNDSAIAAFLNGDSASTIEIDHDLNYIEIPLEVRLRLNSGDLQVSTIFGMSYMMLIDQYFTARNSNSSLRFGRATFINDANFNVNAGLGLRYKIYNRFYLNTDFMFKYQIQTYSQTRDIDPAYFNIQLGIEYKL